MTSLGTASVKQLTLPLAPPEDEARSGSPRRDAPVCLPNLLERALERSNMFRALRRVRRNKGAPGVDGMTVEELPGYLKTHWPETRAALLNGNYRPHPVLRKEIPKPGFMTVHSNVELRPVAATPLHAEGVLPYDDPVLAWRCQSRCPHCGAQCELPEAHSDTYHRHGNPPNDHIWYAG